MDDGMPRFGSRLCVLAVALALAVGPVLGDLMLSLSPGCASCPAQCPMHTRRGGCHDGGRPSCAHARADGLRSTCGHQPECGEEAADWCATVPAALATAPAVASAALSPVRVSPPRDPLPEPLSDPPRGLVG